MTRGELIQACNDAFVWANEGEIESVLDVAEPLIRADERERFREAMELAEAEVSALRRDRADLRAKVDALPTWSRLAQDDLVQRADVLALLDGDGHE